MKESAQAESHDGSVLDPSQGAHSRSFARIVWKRMRRDHYAMAGLLVIATLFALSWLAPVIANNKPIIMRWQDRTLFPAVAEMVPFKFFVKYPQLVTLDFEQLKYDDSVALVATDGDPVITGAYRMA